MKMYHSVIYRKILSFLLRQGKPVLTKDLLVYLGIPEHPSRVEYNRGYLPVWRLITRGWLAPSSAGIGRANYVSLTRSGKEVARQWEAEVKPLVEIYAGGLEGEPAPTSRDKVVARSNNITPGKASPHPVIACPLPPAKTIICDVCGDHVDILEAKDSHAACGKVICTCGQTGLNKNRRACEDVLGKDRVKRGQNDFLDLAFYGGL